MDGRVSAAGTLSGCYLSIAQTEGQFKANPSHGGEMAVLRKVL